MLLLSFVIATSTFVVAYDIGHKKGWSDYDKLDQKIKQSFAPVNKKIEEQRKREYFASDEFKKDFQAFSRKERA